jgi:hypothetical protein
MTLAGYTGEVGSLGSSSIVDWLVWPIRLVAPRPELTARRHLLCKIEGLPRGFEYFFGSPVRLRMRESKARHVAPASLCTLRWAPWEIFDLIITLTMILERRSNCWGGFGFVGTNALNQK